MRKKIKLKSKREDNFLIVLIIICNTLFLLVNLSRSLSPKILNIANTKLQEISSSIILKNVKNIVTQNIKIDELLIINKNNKDEIISIDYNLSKAYEILNNFSNEMSKNINLIETGNIKNTSYINEAFLNKNSVNGLEVLIPIGATFNNALFANFGPKIPAKIMFIGNIYANIKTKVTSYGFNNALLEIYLEFSLNNTVVVPSKSKSNEFKGEILLGAKAIQGRVPFIAGESLERKTETIAIPITE